MKVVTPRHPTGYRDVTTEGLGQHLLADVSNPFTNAGEAGLAMPSPNRPFSQPLRVDRGRGRGASCPCRRYGGRDPAAAAVRAQNIALVTSA